MHHLCKLGVLHEFLNCGSDQLTTTQDLTTQFTEHIGEYGLSYGTEEEFKFRLGLFTQKDKEINQINGDSSNTFTVGHNKFSTWTTDEQQKIMGFRANVNPKEPTILPVTDKVAVDWRTKGAVNPVKDQ